MNNQTQTTTADTNLHTCAICKQAGGQGANWFLMIEGQPGRRVHRPCGNNALKAAPEGVKAELVPSKEQKMLWRGQRDTRQVQSFWNDAFAKAKPLRDTSTPVVVPPPVSIQVAQAA